MSVYLENPVNYRDIVKVGDKIRSWDFAPMEGREDRYVEGIVIEEFADGFIKIQVTKDSVEWGDGSDRVGLVVHAPYWTSLDWKNRIEILEPEHNCSGPCRVCDKGYY